MLDIYFGTFILVAYVKGHFFNNKKLLFAFVLILFSHTFESVSFFLKYLLESCLLNMKLLNAIQGIKI